MELLAVQKRLLLSSSLQNTFLTSRCGTFNLNLLFYASYAIKFHARLQRLTWLEMSYVLVKLQSFLKVVTG